MEVYNKLHEFIRSIKDSSEFKNFKTAKSVIDSNEKDKSMVSDFRQKQMEIQTMQMVGQEVPKEKMEQLQNLYNILIIKNEISEYLNAELKFNQLMNDLFNILGQEIGKDLEL